MCIMWFKAKVELKKKQKEKNTKELLYEISVKNAKIEILEKQVKTSYRDGLLQKQSDKDVEIIQLKTQLHTQPKEIVEKIKNFMDENTYYYEEERFAKDIAEYLDKILKEYEEK